MNAISNSRAATDTSHRIRYPNSRRRAIKLVSMGPASTGIVRRIEARNMENVHIIVPDVRRELTEADMRQALTGADMVFVVACRGEDASLAPLVRQVMRGTGVLVSGILVTSDTEPSTVELTTLRAASDMLVITSGEDYITDMLVELGA